MELVQNRVHWRALVLGVETSISVTIVSVS